MFTRPLAYVFVSLVTAACSAASTQSAADVRYGRITHLNSIGEDAGVQHIVVTMDDGGTVESTQMRNPSLWNGALVVVVPDGSGFWVRPR